MNRVKPTADKLALKDTTFIIPLRIESEDRMRNIITTLYYLLDQTKAYIIIKEVDTEPVFNDPDGPVITMFRDSFFACGYWETKIIGEGKTIENGNRITYMFEQSDDEVFHRTKILNDMLMEVKTPITVNYDCDVIFPLTSYVEAERLVRDRIYDVVYPYGKGDWQWRVGAQGGYAPATDDIVSSWINADFNLKLLEMFGYKYDANVGFAQFFRTEDYIKGGMENEGFIAYGYEDDERSYRFETMGYKVGRVTDFVYHLEHSRTPNSWFTNPHIDNNKKLWESLKDLDKEQLLEYYANVDYMKSRTEQLVGK